MHAKRVTSFIYETTVYVFRRMVPRIGETIDSMCKYQRKTITIYIFESQAIVK